MRGLLAWLDAAPGWQILGILLLVSALLFWALERAARAAERRYKARHALRNHPHAWRPTADQLHRRRTTPPRG